MNTPICNFLERYTTENRLRLHMPGHKGEFPHDITEVFGADSLYGSDISGGIIGTSEALAASVFGAKRTCYSCGGSTLAIQAGLALLKARGCKTVAASRYSHRALASAAALLQMNVKWLYPREYMTADVVYDAEAVSGADALFITNIDYYGGTWKFVNPKMPVLIDNAHGSYLKFIDKNIFGTQYLHPLELGFPLMSAESAHKTLPVLTGGAYLHFTDGVDASRAKEMMAMFGSSSPSYLVLESLDRFNSMIADNVQMVNNACEAVAMLKEKLTMAGIPMRKSDPLRVTINARECGMSGFEFARGLRANGVECEMADENYVVLMFSAVTSMEDCERAEMAVLFVPMNVPQPVVKFPAIKPAVDMPMWEAMYKPQRVVPVDRAGGEVCGAMTAPCPPGVPLIFPGEIIDHSVAEALKMHGVKNVSVLTRTGV
ncbi:MAG: amino acid decarboxylase [Lachnospiraceae bacterium]|nr:amino acid decarboxylase [Ruminococcus sp.]MCM1274235.1 amino acid decarboxylase [Lachnospiraceae bacterium]